MALIDEENGLRGGEPSYNMPQNTPLLNWGGPTGLMTLLQFQPKVDAPILKKDSGKLPKTLKGKLRGYINEQERIDNRIDEINNEVYAEMPKYNGDFNKFQQENTDKIKELQTLVYQKKGLDEAKINLERIKDEYEKKIALMDANGSSGNMVYNNGYVLHKTIDPKTKEIVPLTNNSPKDSPDLGIMNYGEYMKWVGDKDQSLNEIDFLPDIVGLNKKAGYGQNAINDYIRSASDKYQGTSSSNEGNLDKIKNITTGDVDASGNPIDPTAYKMSFIIGYSSSNTSNEMNLNTALGLFSDGKNNGYDISGFMKTLTPLQKQDLMDDYLRVAQSSVHSDDKTPLDLTPSETNNDFKKYVLSRMISTANPLYSTKTSYGQSFEWMPDKYNDKKDDNNNIAYWSDLDSQPKSNTTGTVITQNGFSDPKVYQKKGVGIGSWFAPSQVVSYNSMIENNTKNGLYSNLKDYNGEAFYFAGVPTPMNKLSNKTWIVAATGVGKEQILQKDFNGNVIPVSLESWNNSKKQMNDWSNVEPFIPGSNNKNLNTSQTPTKIGLNPVWTGGKETDHTGGMVKTNQIIIAMNKEDFPEVTNNWNGFKWTNDQGLIINQGGSDLPGALTGGDQNEILLKLIEQTGSKIEVKKNKNRKDGTIGDVVEVTVDNVINKNTSINFEEFYNKKKLYNFQQNQILNEQKNQSNFNNTQYNVANQLYEIPNTK